MDSLQLDATTLAVISGAIIPILTGIATKLGTSSGVKAVVNFLLSAVAGALSVVLAQGGALDWKQFAIAIGMTWVVSSATYFGLYKPTGTTDKVQESTAGFGV